MKESRLENSLVVARGMFFFSSNRVSQDPKYGSWRTEAGKGGGSKNIKRKKNCTL